MARGGLLGAATVLAVSVAVAGCAEGSGSGTDSSGPSSSQSDSTGEDPSGTKASSPAAGQDIFSSGVDELRDGLWQVGGAGEVEFAVSDGALSLTEARPAQGWQHRVIDDDADEIEVHFTQGTTKWKFEVEIDDSTLEISQELTLTGAEGGNYRVGSAGEVSFAIDSSTVSLGTIASGDGWNHATQEESSSSIEIGFANDNGGTAEFEVETRRGGVEVEISQKLTGPTPEQ